jgi:hypothetical protein
MFDDVDFKGLNLDFFFIEQPRMFRQSFLQSSARDSSVTDAVALSHIRTATLSQ